MRQTDSQATLDALSKERKKALILKMLADDASIRNHTQPWMEKLQWALRSTRQEQKLRRAYTPTP